MAQKINSLFESLLDEKIMIFFFVIPLLLLFHLSRHRNRYPPGPRGWPFIGNMNMMEKLTHRGLADLAKHYGGILHLQMGFRHTVAVSTPDVARQVLQLQDHNFSNRSATIAIKYLTYDQADMAFAHYGPFWRQMRKLCVMNLFSHKRAKSWDSVRVEVDDMIRTLAINAGTTVNIGESVFGLTRNIIYRAAFGASCTQGQDEFIKIMQEFSKLFGAFNIADFFPWLSWIDPQGVTDRLKQARTSLDRFIDTIIDEHMMKKKKKVVEKSDDDDNTDMVDELLVFYSDETAKVVSESYNLNNTIKLTRDNIKAIIMDVMFGGTETVASALEWVMAELMRSPEDLMKVQQELSDMVGLERKVEETDLDNLTFLKCCIKETLRLHPPIPVLLHETAKAAEVSGFYIPAKTRVMINAWAIGRDKNSWVDPDEFKPSRFLKDKAPDFRGNHFEFIPFGSGRRSCPGMQLGLYAVEMTVAHLCHCFSWELPDGMKPSDVNMDDIFGLTAPKATRMVAVPTPRLLCKLY